jgi:hypothetical protein
MAIWEASDCIETLLDLVCYEMHTSRLSPEMKGLFEIHLQECPSCRARVAELECVLSPDEPNPDFG